LFRTTDIGRFSKTAALAAEEPASMSTSNRPIWSAVHFLLPMRTMWANPACRDWFQNEAGRAPSGLSRAFQHMGLQPFPVPEKGAQRQSDLPMLIAFRAGWKRARVPQNVAPLLNKVRHAMERRIQRQGTSNRRHDATYVDSRSPGAGDLFNLPLRISLSLVNIAHLPGLSCGPLAFPQPGCVAIYSSSSI
jgi:hypothetical protein